MKFSAAVVLLVCVASVYAAPNSRQSNTNCNVNINTNTNMNQDFNSIYGSFSQLTNNQNAGKRILDIEAAVADPTGRDVAGDVAENVDEQDLAEGKLKGYHHNRPRPQSSSINYNSNYNQNNNFDYNSVLASLFEQLTSQQTININEKPIDFLVFSAHPGVHGKSIPATTATLGRCFYLCPYNYDPICGTDGITYPNRCALRGKNKCEGSNIRKAYDGPC